MLDVEEAGKRFVSIGKTIAEENVDVRDDMLAACSDIESSGGVMLRAARSYLEDPCSKDKRDVMTEAARELLSAVTRLLVIADIVDANRVRGVARKVSFLWKTVGKIIAINKLVIVIARKTMKTQLDNQKISLCIKEARPYLFLDPDSG